MGRTGRFAAGLSLLLVVLLQGCSGVLGLRRSVPSGYGELRVYLEPLGPEASRLKFTLGEAWAERSDGAKVPLPLTFREIDGSAPQRQRLLLEDALPPGTYRAVFLRVAGATVRDEEGETALKVADEPARAAVTWESRVDRPLFQRWELRLDASFSGGGVVFSPVFAPSRDPAPTPALLGYVASRSARHLTLFDKKRAVVTGLLPTGRGPCAVALDPTGLRGYVALAEEDAVDVVDLRTTEVVERIDLHHGDQPREVHLLADRRTLLLVNAGTDTVSFVDATAAAETARVNVGHGPWSLTLDRLGRRAFVLNAVSNTVSVLDLGSRTVAATFSTQPGPVAGQFNRAGDRLYVAHSGSPYLLALDPFTGAVVKKLLLGGRATALKVDPVTDLLYVALAGGGAVAVYDPFSFLPVDRLPVPGEAARLTLDAGERTLYAVQPSAGLVSAVNLVNRRLSAEVDVGGEPVWLAVTGER